MKSCYFIAIAALFAMSSLAHGALISTSLGNNSPGFADGSHPTTATVIAALTGPAPFNAICGSDTGSNASTNCSANWTFNYSIPAGDTITGATLTLGIWDIDSKAAGNQVASYLLTGGDDLTALLNTAAEGLNAGTGATNNEFDIFAVTIPSTSFSQLATGTAKISLALQAPGLGVLGNSPSNGAGLVFSTLDIETREVSNVPEPSYFALVPMALGGLTLLRRRRKIR